MSSCWLEDEGRKVRSRFFPAGERGRNVEILWCIAVGIGEVASAGCVGILASSLCMDHRMGRPTASTENQGEKKHRRAWCSGYKE
jgi:hypothetical protein